MSKPAGKLYVALLSIHGLIRGHNLELGRDADTGGQILYVLELAQALMRHPDVACVDLITRRVVDETVDDDYAVPVEILSDKLRIVHIDTGVDEHYLPKEQLWDHLDSCADNVVSFFRESGALPDIIHSHHLWLASAVARKLFPAIPMVTSCHSTDLRQFLQCPHLRDRVLPHCRKIDRVLALSGDQADKIRKPYRIDVRRTDIFVGG